MSNTLQLIESTRLVYSRDESTTYNQVFKNDNLQVSIIRNKSYEVDGVWLKDSCGEFTKEVTTSYYEDTVILRLLVGELDIEQDYDEDVNYDDSDDLFDEKRDNSI